MKKLKVIKKVVEFNANKSKVWELLTNPEMTQQYMFGSKVLSQWTVDSSIIWKGKTNDGQEIIYVKGKIVEIKEEEKIVFTMFDPTAKIEDIPENYAYLTYEISKSKQGTTLKITQDFEGVAKAEERYRESINSWDMVVDKMKQILMMN